MFVERWGLTKVVHAYAQRCGFLEAHAIRDRDLQIAFCSDILSEGAILVVVAVASMNEAANTVALREFFCYVVTHFQHRAGIIATDCSARFALTVDMLPVGRKFRDWGVWDEASVSAALNHNRLLLRSHD